MNVQCSVTGVTRAGNTITTNPVGYFVQFFDVAEGNGGTFIQPPGSGGTVNTGPSSGTGSATADELIDGDELDAAGLGNSAVAGDEFFIE
jgi:hypothetical protein